jgi:glucan-binding YG repeat protein
LKLLWSVLLLLTTLTLQPGAFFEEKAVNAGAVSVPIHLGFKPEDTVVDPTKPIIYMTELGAKKLYAVNYQTGEVSTLDLPYPAERLELFQQSLYVTQHKLPHNHFNHYGPYYGAIAEVDTVDFRVTGVMDIDADPFDIAIDENGLIYISPGSGQWTEVKVYSLADKTEVVNKPEFGIMREMSTIFYHPHFSRVYWLDQDIYAFDVDHGKILHEYWHDSPYHGDYPLNKTAELSPDGLSMYNTSGLVSQLALDKTKDMYIRFKFARSYNDYEFRQGAYTFAARTDPGIDVYKYDTDEYLHTIPTDGQVIKLFDQDGLMAVVKDSSGNYVFKSIDTGSSLIQDPPFIFKQTEMKVTYFDDLGNYKNVDFYNGMKNVPTGAVFAIYFNDKFYIDKSSRITLTRPEENVYIKESTYPDRSVLYISPTFHLKADTLYTLTISDGALSKYLRNDIVVQFKTEPAKIGWVLVDGKWVYYSPTTQQLLKGWQLISGKWYFFNDVGVMQTGWLKSGQTWYYLLGSGEMKTGWLKEGNTWYYLTGSGAMKTGWLKLGTTWYYFNDGGAMKTGWLKLGTTWYYFDGSGSMKTGWLKVGTTWYYFNSSGAMATGWQNISGKKYYFDSSGVLK